MGASNRDEVFSQDRLFDAVRESGKQVSVVIKEAISLEKDDPDYVSEGAVRNLLRPNGTQNPGPKVLQRIATVIKVPITRFYEPSRDVALKRARISREDVLATVDAVSEIKAAIRTIAVTPSELDGQINQTINLASRAMSLLEQRSKQEAVSKKREDLVALIFLLTTQLPKDSDEDKLFIQNMIAGLYEELIRMGASSEQISSLKAKSLQALPSLSTTEQL